ncbi:MAG: hypothetical protein Q9170_001572 [Blastenia crenularia]
MEELHDHGIDPRVLDIRNASIFDHYTSSPSHELDLEEDPNSFIAFDQDTANETISADQSNRSLLSFVGSGPTDEPTSNGPASIREGDISFESTFAPKTLQRRSEDPWTQLQTNEDPDHEMPDIPYDDVTLGSSHNRKGRITQANQYQASPQSHPIDELVWQPGSPYDPKMQARSGLSSLFTTKPKPPAVIVDGEDSLMSPSWIEQQCPVSNLVQFIGDPCESGTYNHYDDAFNAPNPPSPSDPPPSILSTDESFLDEGLLEGGNPLSCFDDIYGNGRDVLQHRRQSSAGIGCTSSNGNECPVRQGMRYDNRFLSPVDPRSRPEAVPRRWPYDCFKPGIAASYPPAATDCQHRGRSTERHIAPRSSGAATECTTPRSMALPEVGTLAIVREDGKGGTLLSPSTPKRGRRVCG